MEFYAKKSSGKSTKFKNWSECLCDLPDHSDHRSLLLRVAERDADGEEDHHHDGDAERPEQLFVAGGGLFGGNPVGTAAVVGLHI